MGIPENVLTFDRSGRYLDALEAVEALPSTERERVPAQILRAELLERVGQHTQSRAIAERLLKTAKLNVGERATCEDVIGRILVEDGQTNEGLERIQRAATLSARAGDLKQLCWIQGKLWLVIADRSGRDAAAPLFAELRRNIIKLGDRQTTAMVHLHVSEMEARQGFLDSACRHVRVLQDLLVESPNLRLEALAENVLLAVCLLRSDVSAARLHSEKALTLSQASGTAAALRSAAANTGNLFFICGDFERAFAYFERASTFLRSAGDKNNGIVEALAQVRLAQGKFDECEQLLNDIDRTIRTDRDRTFYAHRYAELTRTRLLARQGKVSQALQNVEFLQGLCDLTGDQILSKTALLTKAALLQSCGRTSECVEILAQVMRQAGGHSPETFARYQYVSALALLGDRNRAAAQDYVDRATRICSITCNRPALLEFEQSLKTLQGHQAQPTPDRERSDAPGDRAAKSAIHALAAITLHASRPELMASELAQLLVQSGCARCVRVVSRHENGEEQVLRDVGAADGDSLADARRFMLAEADGRSVEILASPHQSLEAAITLNMIPVLIQAIRLLQEARFDRERRAMLWPVEELQTEELSNEEQSAVISGQMRELMTSARRVARTTVHVLITGESGTGKEILARAIHNFSNRAQKPFVPFNCAAIPRDLLESQLFGHRRGTFTGADRDHVGLIRSASGGTLFLDEIGEMSLELQPKLLRFLESGEIAPLGEPSVTVDVRVLAATNSDLEDAVRAGRFREDLFYRLNVVRLAIKPLRERRDEIPGMINHFVAVAVREFDKGRLQVSEEATERLLLYRWPGNVRQLLNEVRRIVALAEPDSTIEPNAISDGILGALPDLRRTSPAEPDLAVLRTQKLLPALSRIEYEMVKAALREHDGKMEAAARSLGISRKGLYLKRRRLGL